jgi:hypothetical protein
MSLRVGPHEFLVRLSAGPTRNTYLARSEAGGRARLLTIRVLRPDADDDQDAARRFLNEARTLARIRHPNVIETAGYGVIGNLHCIGTEFVFGVTLAEAMQEGARRKGGLSAQVALRIMGAILDGLDAAHRATDEAGRPLGLVHRAVTPGNILVGFNGAPKLADFRLVKAAHRGWETIPGRVTGKTSYMSPEQLLSRDLDGRSDVFCAGVVLWELLAQRPLFRGTQLIEVARAITQGRVPPPSRYAEGLPAGTDEVVLKALAKQPEQRFASAGEMAGAIDQLFLTAGLAVEPAQVAMELARLFGPRIAARARALKAAMAGLEAEAALCDTLAAEPIDDEDLLHSYQPPTPRKASFMIPDAPTEVNRRALDDQATVVVERPAELAGIMARVAPRRASTELPQQGWNDTMSVELGDELRAQVDAQSTPAEDEGDEIMEETEQG